MILQKIISTFPTDLPFCYGSSEELNVLIDNVSKPCACMAQIVDSQAVKVGGQVCEQVNVIVFFLDVTEWESYSVENEEIITNCKEIADNWLSELRDNVAFSIIGDIRYRRVYLQYNGYYTGIGVNLTLRENRGIASCTPPTPPPTPILPDEYQQVEWIGTDGSSYTLLDSSINFAEGDVLKGRIYVPPYQRDVQCGFGQVDFGKTFTISNNYGTVGYSVGINDWAKQQSGAIIDTSSAPYNTGFWADIVYDNVNSYSQLGDATSNIANLPTTTNTYRYGVFTDGHYLVRIWKGLKIEYLKIENKMWLLPCYRKVDNVKGLYDVTNQVFYTNLGAGDFLIGNDVN